MSDYVDLKEKHKKEFDEFPCFFAFSILQFNEGMEKFGYDPQKDKDKIYKSPAGMFYKRTDASKLRGMCNRHTTEVNKAITDDTTGEGYIFEMFDYELANHEYCYTGDITDTLDALGLTMKEILITPNLNKGLKLAIREQHEE